MSDPAIPNTVEEFLAAYRDEAGVEVVVRCQSCGVTITVILPYIPDPPPTVVCAKHLEDGR